MRGELSVGSVAVAAWLLASCTQPVEPSSAVPASAVPASAESSGSGRGEPPEVNDSDYGSASSPPTTDAPLLGANSESPESEAEPSEADIDAGASATDTTPVFTADAEVTLPAQPVVWKTLSVSEAVDARFSSPGVASRDDEAAVAYVENVGDERRIMLQRFDATGERLGEAVALGPQPDLNVGPTLASDGKQYAVCWSDTQIHCSTLDEENQAHTGVLELEGKYPTIVFAHGSWVISYFTDDEQIQLQVLSSALELQGDPTTFIGSLRYHAPLLVPTESGFALVGARPTEGEEAYLYRLDSDLELSAQPQPLGHDFWYYGDLAATDRRAAVSLSVPYGSYTLLLDAEGVKHQLAVGGGGKTGMYLSLLAREGGIVATWFVGDADLKTRFFADGDPELDLPAPTGAAGNGLDLGQEGTDSYHQLVQVGAQTLLVAMKAMFGTTYGENGIRVTTLTAQ